MCALAKTIAIYHLVKNRTKQADPRRFWVHPILIERPVAGSFVVLFQKLREDDLKFFNYFRMSIKSFDELSSKVERDLKKEDIVRLSISPTERLAVTLRYVICFFFK